MRALSPRSMNLMATCSPVLRSLASCTKPKAPLLRSATCRQVSLPHCGGGMLHRWPPGLWQARSTFMYLGWPNRGSVLRGCSRSAAILMA